MLVVKYMLNLQLPEAREVRVGLQAQEFNLDLPENKAKMDIVL
jgi:hypothetical protein